MRWGAKRSISTKSQATRSDLYPRGQWCGRENPMARVFISGSSDGLGLMAGKLLAEQGHRVTRSHLIREENSSRPPATWRGRSTRSAVSTRSSTTPPSAIGKAIASPATACRMSSRSTRSPPARTARSISATSARLRSVRAARLRSKQIVSVGSRQHPDHET